MRIKLIRSILIVLFCILSSCSSAQTIQAGQYKIDRHVYEVSKTKTGDHLLIRDNTSLISQRLSDPKALTTLEAVKFSGKEDLRDAFAKVIGLGRIRELLPESNIVIYLYLNTDGRAEAVQYLLGGNGHTKLTFDEINRLTDYIKKNITVEIPADIDKNASLAPVHQSIRFSTLVE